MYVGGGDEGTNYYVCRNCDKPCNPDTDHAKDHIATEECYNHPECGHFGDNEAETLHNKSKGRKKVYTPPSQRKTNKELAEYLSFIYPQNRDIYEAIALFLGENEPMSTKYITK